MFKYGARKRFLVAWDNTKPRPALARRGVDCPDGAPNGRIRPRSASQAPAAYRTTAICSVALKSAPVARRK